MAGPGHVLVLPGGGRRDLRPQPDGRGESASHRRPEPLQEPINIGRELPRRTEQRGHHKRHPQIYDGIVGAGVAPHAAPELGDRGRVLPGGIVHERFGKSADADFFVRLGGRLLLHRRAVRRLVRRTPKTAAAADIESPAAAGVRGARKARWRRPRTGPTGSADLAARGLAGHGAAAAGLQQEWHQASGRFRVGGAGHFPDAWAHGRVRCLVLQRAFRHAPALDPAQHPLLLHRRPRGAPGLLFVVLDAGLPHVRPRADGALPRQVDGVPGPREEVHQRVDQRHKGHALLVGPRERGQGYVRILQIAT
mmetsp:Transcript_38924/g.117541  ORF Transcript_38924/g.117541 Transcript_38924/m.117541 type:complete len:308 (-) Transcript_38924:838-1761(-)